MNLKNILSEIGQTDPEVYEQPKDRRQLLKTFGAKVAVASLPFAASTLFSNKASAKKTDVTPVQVLNFILELEYLAYNFYHTANNVGIGGPAPLIPTADQAGFLTIEGHKRAHIIYLNSLIISLGGTPYTPTNYNPTAANPYFVVSGAYDFTAGGLYPLVFSDYPTFTMIAVTFEDTFIHGYLGQLQYSLSNTMLQAQLMQLQCVVARDAAYVRLVRRFLGYAAAPEHPAPWITNNIPPIASLQPYYNTEDDTIQEGIDILSLPGYSGTTPQISATAAFDEPFDQTTVIGLLAGFILS